MCWFMAGRVLVRFLRTSIDSNDHDQILTLQNEVSFVRTMLGKAGERVPLACESLTSFSISPPASDTDGLTLSQSATARCSKIRL